MYVFFFFFFHMVKICIYMDIFNLYLRDNKTPTTTTQIMDPIIIY